MDAMSESEYSLKPRKSRKSEHSPREIANDKVVDFAAFKAKVNIHSSAVFETKAWKRSRIKKGYLIARIKGYDPVEGEYGVHYLKVLGRRPKKTSGDYSLYEHAGFFTWQALQAGGGPPWQMPSLQLSPVVHASPSSHGSPVVPKTKQPPALSQVAAVQGTSMKSGRQSVPAGAGMLPTHCPPWQLSTCVQMLKSSQGVPFGAFRSGHTGDDPLQKSGASQTPDGPPLVKHGVPLASS